MEKRRSFRVITFAALLCAVMLLSVGFAVYSSTLEIRGSAKVKSQAWDVHFTSITKDASTTAVELTAPRIEDGATVISGLSLQFDEPGQKATYLFDVKNNGTFDAELTNITIGTPSCVGNGANAITDAANVCKHIKVALQDATGTTLATGVKLASGATQSNLKLVVSYDPNIPENELPTDDVTINSINATLIYTQD